MITAHGGSLHTGRNSKKYFNTIVAYPVNAIEVDLKRKGSVIYLGHILPKLNMNKAIKIKDVLEFCIKYNYMVNCDTKELGLAEEIIKTAKELDANRLLIFTGRTMPDDVKHFTTEKVYVNECFYNSLLGNPCVKNLAEIKKYLDSFGCKALKGINIPYRLASDELIKKAKEIGLGLSVYVVDKPDKIKRLMDYKVDNITTNRPDIALEIYNLINNI